MAVIITCRRCGREFEVDVKASRGEWWQCPFCQTEEPASTVHTKEGDDATEAAAS